MCNVEKRRLVVLKLLRSTVAGFAEQWLQIPFGGPDSRTRTHECSLRCYLTKTWTARHVTGVFPPFQEKIVIAALVLFPVEITKRTRQKEKTSCPARNRFDLMKRIAIPEPLVFQAIRNSHGNLPEFLNLMSDGKSRRCFVKKPKRNVDDDKAATINRQYMCRSAASRTATALLAIVRAAEHGHLRHTSWGHIFNISRV